MPRLSNLSELLRNSLFVVRLNSLSAAHPHLSVAFQAAEPPAAAEAADFMEEAVVADRMAAEVVDRTEAEATVNAISIAP